MDCLISVYSRKKMMGIKKADVKTSAQNDKYANKKGI